MDPFSITVGIVALVTATTQVIKVAERLRASLKAGDEVCALINQLTDLKCVLISADLSQAQPSQDLGQDLASLTQRTNEKLSELEHIICNRLLKDGVTAKARCVDRKSWFREQSRVQSLQKDIRYLTGAFSLALVTSTSMGMARVELAINALTSSAFQSNGITESRLGELHRVMESLQLQTTGLRDILEKQGKLIHEPLNTSRASSPDSSMTSAASSTTTLVASSDPRIDKSEYVKVQTRRLSSSMPCAGPCACSCHGTRRLRSPGYFDNFVGILFTGYTGTPVNRQPCNIRTCKNTQRNFTAHFTYYFPWWFVKRALVTTLKMTNSSGPEITLKIARVVPDTSAIFQLARAGNISGVRYLFENHLASPFDVGGGLASTPLHYAVDRPGNLKMVRFLISAGADPEVQDMKRKTAADRIWNRIFGKGRDDDEQYVDLLGDLSRTEQLERRVFTHLHNIVLDQLPGDLELELKTSYGYNHIDDLDADGMTALNWAARRGDYRAVEVLLQSGADVSIASQTGATPLYYAGASPSMDAPAVIRALLKAGAPVNACTFRKETPLHICVMYHDDPENFIQPLLSYGADAHARDVRGISILDLAIQSDHEKSVGFLLNQGIKLDTVGDDNITGLSVAIIYNSHNVLKLIMDRGEDSSLMSKEKKTLLHLAAANADCETFDVLTSYGLDVDREARDANGDTAGEIFARRSDRTSVLVLSFEALLDSLGSGSIVFGDMDPKDLTLMATEVLQEKIEDSPTSDDFFDAADHFSRASTFS